MTQLGTSNRKSEAVREKGRKKNYSQFNLREGEWRKQERLLNTEEINSFLEISVRAAACPMPFNMDIWDGLFCLIKGQKVFTQRGEIPVEEIVIGDMVMSYNEIVKEKEWKIVENISNTQKEDLIEIITEKGNKLTLTNNHLVFTQRGWVKAGELSIEDELLEL
jgi:hypothetical protein